MKVDFQCGDFITIPEGCKAIIKGGSVVFEKEEQEFKDGDVLCSLYNSTMLIFKEEYKDHSNRFYTRYNTNHSSNEKWNKDAFRLATEEEKKLLFDKMKEQGLKWNAEEKRVEKIRWRAKKGENYYFFDAKLVVRNIDEAYSAFDNEVWDAFNHFRKEEQAKEAAKRVKEALKKYCEEIGE